MTAEQHIPANYQPAAGLLQGRSVLITGATGGLGRAMALACAQHGATVILLGRNISQLEQVYDAIKAAGGAEPAIYPLNLAGATWNDYAELATTLEREFGTLHGLLHCATHFKGFMPLGDIDPRDWMESLQINLTGPYALTRRCMPLLQKAQDASVVFVSDAAGRTGRAYHGAYGVTKFALEGLMQTWAHELEGTSSVRVNSFDPGPLKTAMRLRGYPGEAAASVPAPETVCNAVLYLLGPDSRRITGQAL